MPERADGINVEALAEGTPAAGRRPPAADSLPLDARAIESEVARLWREAAASAAGGLVRASSMTVLAMLLDPTAQERVEAVLAQAPAAYPCRVIVVSHGAGEPRAHLSAYCRPPTNGRAPICWEEIRLEGATAALDRVMSAARALVIPNLPVQVWWPHDVDFAGPLFDQTVEIGGRLIVDSAQFGNPLNALCAYADRAEQEHGTVGFADLNWRRIEPWRLLLAQLFDTPDDRAFLGYVESVVVRLARAQSGADVGLSSALLMVGWLAGRLGWSPPATPLGDRDVEHVLYDDGGRAVRVELRRTSSAQPPDGLVSVELHAAIDERTATYSVRRTADGAATLAEVDGDRREAAVSLPVASEADLLELELSDFGRDRILEEALQAARPLGRRAAHPAAPR